MKKIRILTAILAVFLLSACAKEVAPQEATSEKQPSAKSELISVEQPIPYATINSPLSVSGEARGYWFFEADFPIELIDADGNRVAMAIGHAQGEWMTEEFVPFESTLEFDTPATKTGTLIFHKDNPSGLPEYDDRLEVPVHFDLSAAEEVPYRVEEYASELEIPWGMVFTSKDRMLVTERPGRLRVVEKGNLLPEPIHTFEDVSTEDEEGLMSVEIDPNYRRNKWIYVSTAYQNEDEEIRVKVVRFTDRDDHLEDETIILDDLPAAKYHAGSRIKFGPDGKLYVTVGDAFDKDLAQDLTVYNGKLLRMNPDGSRPEDNPTGSLIYSYGHRNSQGIDWHPENSQLYESEHGPSIIDGPKGGDEINRIIPGGNYGWPLVSHDERMEGTIPPLIQFTPAEPPASLLIYSGKVFPQFKNNLFFGSLGGEGIMRLVLDEKNPDAILFNEKLFEEEYGRIRDVIEGPDGYIYFSTSNADGRGDRDDEDDKIYRIIP